MSTRLSYAHAFRVPWTLLPWICPEMLHYEEILSNPNSTDYIMQILDQINSVDKTSPFGVVIYNIQIINKLGFALSSKPGAEYTFKEGLDHVHWYRVVNDKMILRNLNRVIAARDEGRLYTSFNIVEIMARYPNIWHNWYAISRNPHAIDILRANPQSIMWPRLCSNTNARDLLMEEYERGGNLLRWYALSSNPCARDILIAESTRVPCRIVWSSICYNTNVPELIETLIENYPDDANKCALSSNPSIIHIMLKHIDLIHWDLFLELPGVPALVRDFRHLIIPVNLRCKYPELVDYDNITSSINYNKSAMSFLSQHQDLIIPCEFSQNSAIFELDFKRASVERTAIIRDELMARALNPERVARWKNSGADLAFC